MSVAKIVILNWNGVGHLRRYLPSVVQAAPSGVEVVVADNGSTDDSLAVLAAEFPTVRVVRLDRNYGFAGGYNRALAQIKADYYVLLNSDVETPRGGSRRCSIRWSAIPTSRPSPRRSSRGWTAAALNMPVRQGATSTFWAIPSAGAASCARWRRTGGSTTMHATCSG